MIRIGYSKKKLTPQRDVYLGGYIDVDGDQNLCRYPQDILSDIFVTALCMEQNQIRVILVCVENCLNIDGETTPAGFFHGIAQLAGVPDENVWVTNTHNHQSLKYLQQPEVEIIYHAVQEAISDLRPATVLYTAMTSDVGVNRRPKYIVSPQLPYDNTLPILCFRTEGRKDLLLINYQIHNTAFGVGRMQNAHLMFGELMGETCAQLEKEMQCVVFFANGFYGAAGPNIRGKSSADFEEICAAGKAFAHEIAQALKHLQPFPATGDLRVYSSTHALPVNPVYGHNAKELLHVRVVRIGALAALAVDCEPFSELGSWLRAYSPFPCTILLGNVNGFSGYIPTDEAFDAGEEERECRLNKTPYCKGISQLFCTLCLRALYHAAGMPVPEAKELPMQSLGGGQYAAHFCPCEMNRIVVDFGFMSRNHCASRFTVSVGTELFEICENSCNFVPISFSTRRVEQVILTVKETYDATALPDALPIRVFGLQIPQPEAQ